MSPVHPSRVLSERLGILGDGPEAHHLVLGGRPVGLANDQHPIVESHLVTGPKERSTRRGRHSTDDAAHGSGFVSRPLDGVDLGHDSFDDGLGVGCSKDLAVGSPHRGRVPSGGVVGHDPERDAHVAVSFLGHLEVLRPRVQECVPEVPRSGPPLKHVGEPAHEDEVGGEAIHRLRLDRLDVLSCRPVKVPRGEVDEVDPSQRSKDRELGLHHLGSQSEGPDDLAREGDVDVAHGRSFASHSSSQ